MGDGEKEDSRMTAPPRTSYQLRKNDEVKYRNNEELYTIVEVSAKKTTKTSNIQKKNGDRIIFNVADPKDNPEPYTLVEVDEELPTTYNIQKKKNKDDDDDDPMICGVHGSELTLWQCHDGGQNEAADYDQIIKQEEEEVLPTSPQARV